MDQAPKQRPCVVIGTYDSFHHNHNHHHPHPHPYQIDDSPAHQDVGDKSTRKLADFEQSTDLFSYCRSAQLNLNFNPLRKNSPGDQSATNNHQCNQRTQPTKLRLKLNLSQIKGPSGSVRGHKDVVRKSLENIRAVASISNRRNFNSASFQSFQSPFNQLSADGFNSLACSSLMMQVDEQHKAEYLERLYECELGQCVAYTTTLGVVRRTFEDCKLMRSILNSNLIKYEERDIYLNQEYKKQLRLRCNTIQVPVLFVDGKHFGGIKEVERMNEDGYLAIQLAQYKMSEAPKHVCHCCGNAKFIACQSCNGSRKSAVHHFKYNSIALRCIKCDENDGLVDCPVCSSSSSSSAVFSDVPLVEKNEQTEATPDNNNNDRDVDART